MYRGMYLYLHTPVLYISTTHKKVSGRGVRGCLFFRVTRFKYFEGLQKSLLLTDVEFTCENP
jgi:hypothetical protein